MPRCRHSAPLVGLQFRPWWFGRLTSCSSPEVGIVQAGQSDGAGQTRQRGLHKAAEAAGSALPGPSQQRCAWTCPRSSWQQMRPKATTAAGMRQGERSAAGMPTAGSEAARTACGVARHGRQLLKIAAAVMLNQASQQQLDGLCLPDSTLTAERQQ